MLLFLSFAAVTALHANAPDTTEQEKEIFRLDSLMLHHLNGDELDKALEFANKAVQYAKEQYGVADTHYLDQTNIKAMVLLRQKKFEEGYALLQSTLLAQKKLLGEKHYKHAYVYHNLGEYYEDLEEYDKSIDYYKRAIALKTEKFGANHEELAPSLNNIANVYSDLDSFELTKKYYLRAIAIHKKNKGPTSQEYATALSNYTNVLRTQGKYSEALQALEEVIKIRETLYGPNELGVTGALVKYGTTLERLGRYNEALTILNRALEIRLTHLDSSHNDVGYVYMHLGLLYRNLNDYETAEIIYLKAKDIFRKIYGDKSTTYGAISLMLGDAYLRNLKLDPAEQVINLAYEIYKEKLGTKNRRTAIALSKLASIARKKKNYTKAIELQKEVVAAQISSHGPVHRSVGDSYTSLASIYSEAKQFEECFQLIPVILPIYEKVIGKEHVSYGSKLSDISIWYNRAEQFTEARDFAQKALKIHAKTVGMSHPLYFNGLRNLAEINLKMGNVDTASVLLAKSLQLNCQDSLVTLGYELDWIKAIQKKEILSDIHLIYFLETLELYYNTKQQYKEAFKTAQSGMYIVNSFKVKLNSQTDKLQLSKYNYNFSKRAVKNALRADEAQLIDDAFSIIEQNKSTILTATLRAEKLGAIGMIPDSLVQQQEQLAQQVDEARKKLYQSKDKHSIRQEISALQEKQQSLRQTIKSNYPKYYQQQYEQGKVTIQEIQASLEADQLFLEYFIADSTIYVFSIHKGSSKLHTIHAKPSELKSKVSQLRKTLTDYNFIRAEKEKALEQYLHTAYWCYAHLLEKILTQHPEKNRLIIVTDGALGHLPFESFLSQSVAPDTSVSLKKLPYLLNSHTISYNYSALLWEQSLKQSRQQLQNLRTLAIAAAYNQKEDNEVRAVRALHLRNLRDALTDLPAARSEVESLSKILQGAFLYDQAANEARFKSSAKEYGVIHLAMHGLLNKQQPILSSLAFTENGDSLEDNFLQAHEISHLDLHAQLVVLSACETGYGKFEQGEGVMSLARSFMYAGVPSLVVSLWQVNDASTSIIMQNFYANLAKGWDKARALQQAKLDYIAHAKTDMAAHPAFWAPFIQLGDSRPIKLARKGSGSWVWWAVGAAGLLVLVIGVSMSRKHSKAA